MVEVSDAAAPLVEVPKARRALSNLLTERLRVLLEVRSIRMFAIGVMLVAASGFSLIPSPIEVDSGWMFILPVAISAIAGGLKEGLFVAMCAAALASIFTTAHVLLEAPVLVSVFTTRFALYGITAAVLGSFAEAHYSVQSNLRELATLDPLTKVCNVASFYEHMKHAEQTCSRFAVLLVDMDDLKFLNDKYGHQVGSAAIRTVASVLGRVIRGTDVVARYGGDEFALILREADRAGSQIVANRIRSILANEPIPGGRGEKPSVSIGVAMFSEDGGNSEELLQVADARMYEDKRMRKALRATLSAD